MSDQDIRRALSPVRLGGLHAEPFQAYRAYVEEARRTEPLHSPHLDIEARRAADRDARSRVPKTPVDTVSDLDADGVLCRLYEPAGANGVIMHVHGGGFAFHDIETHDEACRRLANTSSMSVLSVDYRRAPEHKFPAALDDLSTVVRWLGANDWSGPRFIHGDSAGANLALTTAVRHPGTFAGMALIYPFLDPRCESSSYDTAQDSLDRMTTEWFWRQYVTTPEDLEHPEVAPLRHPDTSLGPLPATFISTAEHDPLRDEGEQLAHRLAQLGVEVRAFRQLGAVHGYWDQPERFPDARALMRMTADWFQGIASR